MRDAFDVVVCGFGGAGAAAAIEAHDAGATVCILEKADAGGGSTAESGGSIATILDRDGAVEHYLSLTEGRTPRDVIAAYVDGVLELPAWVAANGGQLEPLPLHRPPFPHRYTGTAYGARARAEAIGERLRMRRAGVTHGGTSLWGFLADNVERRDIDVRLGAPAQRLVGPSDGSISGVEVGVGGTTEVVGARRGVVLGCGGFGVNPSMLLDHVGLDIPALSPPGRNQGDGVLMAQGVGASLWHMNCVAAGFGYAVPGMQAAWMCSVPAFGFFMVDRLGRRFLDEPTVEHHAAAHALMVRDFRTGDHQRVPSYVIFDDRTRAAGPLATREAGANRIHPWSDDNLAEVEKGWIRRADSFEGLARELGLPADALAATAARYNAAVASGHDDFGRAAETMVAVDEPPFYGIAVRPSLFNTQGGPRRSARAEVLDLHGRPIPHLYSAGELGSIWAALYPGAGNVTEALVYGRIAGRRAASP